MSYHTSASLAALTSTADLAEIQRCVNQAITLLDTHSDVAPNLPDNSGSYKPAKPEPDAPRLLSATEPTHDFLSTRYFSKVWAYANSRLPPQLPPFRIYLPTYPLLCLAARYSMSAYSNDAPINTSMGLCTTTSILVPSSLRLGTKAMVLALSPCTSSSTPTLVVAIRGSATFADWAINFRPAPTSPTGFLDDEGNLVHSGFLQVARNTLEPMAQQIQNFLRNQIDAGKWRDQGQLVLTGHSAGGAIAALLFGHILSQSSTVDSRLKQIAKSFKRIHCITFGAPPLSLLPLQRPRPRTLDKEAEKRWKKNLFFSFINEGDPVVRADRPFVRSLLDLYAAPLPAATTNQAPVWPMPANTMSNAGRLILLRTVATAPSKRRGLLGMGKKQENPSDRLEAVVTSDEQLRGVVFGDPLTHSMRLYKDRLDQLATQAVTGGG